MMRVARKVAEAVLYSLMLGTDVFGVLIAMLFGSHEMAASAYGLILGLWSVWLGIFILTLLVSLWACLIGPWRLRRRLALWYLCVAATALLVVDLAGQVGNKSAPLFVVTGFMELVGACSLPIIWLTTLPGARS